MMVSLALGGMLLAGAFQLHAAFARQGTRQQQVADMQQSLRVSRQIMERFIRGAGAGLGGNAITVNQCNGPPVTFYPIEFSNKNPYVNQQRVAFDTITGDLDTDPDWIRMISTNPNFGVGGRASNGANVVVLDQSQFNIGDTFIVLGNNPDPLKRQNCLLEVTQLNNAGGNSCPTCGGVQHNPGGVNGCLNLPPGQDTCLQNVNFPAQIRPITGGLSVFRVERTATQWCPNPPCLGASFTNIGSPPTWQLLSENIDDLQISMIMMNGQVCGDAGHSIDSPILCPPQNVRAIRFTLTARSSSQVSDFQQGLTIAAEDMPVVAAAPDGYLRRSITTVVELRNQ